MERRRGFEQVYICRLEEKIKYNILDCDGLDFQAAIRELFGCLDTTLSVTTSQKHMIAWL